MDAVTKVVPRTMTTLWRLRRRPWVRMVLLGAALIGYAAVSLAPFEWSPPRQVENGAAWSGSSLRLPSEGLVVGRAAPDWLDAAMAAHQLTLELRFRPARTAQWGEILAIGGHGRQQALSISQKNRHLVLRLRRACRHVEAIDLPCATGRVIRRVLEAGQPTDLGLIIQPGGLKLVLDGEMVLERALPEAPLTVWEGDQRLTLGNDSDGSWPWLGEIERAVVGTAEGASDLLQPELYLMPPRYLAFDRAPRLVPFRDAPIKDMVHNLVMYVPLGALLALLGFWPRWSGVLRALLVTGLISLSMESAQLFFSNREPSVTDLLLNAVGGAFGFCLIQAMRTDPRLVRLAERAVGGRARPGRQQA